MKNNLHPTWYSDATVTCSCGNTFKTGSVLAELKVDICSACHPFFTGEIRFVDRQGRVDKFMHRMQVAQAKKSTTKKTKATDDTPVKPAAPAKSYQEILREQQVQLKKAGRTTAAATT